MRKFRFGLEQLESRHLLASDWQNPLRIRDVNADRLVTPQDALIGINHLNTQTSAALPTSREDTQPYLDVNGDGVHTPLDILLVVNSLNSGPLLGVGLTNDTGAGPDANRDHLTYDFSLSGTVQGGAADELLGWLDATASWVDLSHHLDASGKFSISSEQLEESFGLSLGDGAQRLVLSARRTNTPSQFADRVSLEFVVDRTPPAAHLLGDIWMTSPDAIEIPLDEPLSPASLAASRVYLSDITWGDRPAGSPWTGSDWPRLELTPDSVTLSTDGRKLVIRPPLNSRSIKYLIELDRSVEDLAGNPLSASTIDRPMLFRANYFSPSVAALPFGTNVVTPASFNAEVNEFAFSLNSPERIIWSGNLAFGSMATAHLYDAQGELVRTWLSDSSLTFPVPDTSDVVSLPAGQYRLRIVAPPANQCYFGVYRESQLPGLPSSRASGNSNFWPLDVYRTQLSTGDRLLFQAADVSRNQPLPVRSAFDSLNNRIAIQQPNQGQQLIEASPAPQTIIVLHRVGYQRHHTSLRTQPLTAGSWVEGVFTAPGERIVFPFAGTPGDLLVLETNDPDSRYQFSQGGTVLHHGPQVFVMDAAAGQLTVTNTATSSAPSNYRFRVHRLSEAAPLTYRTDIPVPAAGEMQFFAIDQPVAEQILKVSGNVEVQLFRYERELARLTEIGQHAAMLIPAGYYYLMVRTPASAVVPANWQAELVDGTPQRAPLPEGDVVVSFPLGLEHYEFTFHATAGQTLRLDQLQARSALPRLELLDFHRHVLFVFDLQEPRGWRVPFDGQYILSITQPAIAGEDFVFRLGSQLSGPALPPEQVVTASVPVWRRIAYHFTASSDPFLVQFTRTPGNSGQWQILTADQWPVAQGDLSQSPDIEVSLSNGVQYWLVLNAAVSDGEFEFAWRAPHYSQTTIQLGQTVSGTLLGYRDRTELSVTLEAGQAVRVDQWNLAPGITASWLNLPSKPNRIWQAAHAGVYRLLLLNTLPTAGDYELQLSELIVNYDSTGLNGFDTPVSGQAFQESPGEHSALITQNTPFMVDVLSDFQYSLGMEIVDPNGQVLFQGGWKDSPMLLAAMTGNYRVRVTSQMPEIGADRYALRWLTPALAESIEVDSVNLVDLAPHATRLLRVPITDRSWSYLDRPEYLGLLDLPLSARDDLVLPLGDYVVVRASEPSGIPTLVQFSWRSMGAAAVLNRPLTLRTASEQTTVLAVDVTAGQPFRLEFPDGDFMHAAFTLDQNWQAIPTVDGAWVPASAGRVYVGLRAVRFDEQFRDVTIAVTTRPTLSDSLTVGVAWHGQLERAGDRALLTVELTTNMAGVLLQSGVLRTKLIPPRGAPVILDGPPARLPITVNGTYQIEILALVDNAKVTLKLIDLDAQPTILGTSLSGNLTDTDPFAAFKLTGNPGDRWRAQVVAGAIGMQIIDRWAHHYLTDWQIPADGNVWLLVTGSSQYTLALTRPSIETIDANLDQWYSGQLAGNELRYRFQTSVAGQLLFEVVADGQSVSLFDPYGQQLPIILMQTPVVRVAGNSTYELVLGGSNTRSDYRWRVRYFEPTEQLGNIVQRTHELGDAFTVDLADDGRDQWLVDMPVEAGQLIARGAYVADEQMVVRYRLLGVGESNTSPSAWIAIHHFPETLRVMSDGRLQLQITGRGAGRFRWIDLNSAPSLLVDSSQAFTVAPSDQLLAWKLPVQVNRDIVFSNLNAPAGARWSVMDKRGQTLTSIAVGSRISIVSAQPLTLVLKFTDAPTDVVAVAIHIVSL